MALIRLRPSERTIAGFGPMQGPPRDLDWEATLLLCRRQKPPLTVLNREQRIQPNSLLLYRRVSMARHSSISHRFPSQTLELRLLVICAIESGKRQRRSLPKKAAKQLKRNTLPETPKAGRPETR